jgi:hypothetical protein
VIERFRDADAMIEHAANMAEISAKVLQTGTIEGEILGDPGPEIRANLTGPEPQLLLPWLMLKGE